MLVHPRRSTHSVDSEPIPILVGLLKYYIVYLYTLYYPSVSNVIFDPLINLSGLALQYLRWCSDNELVNCLSLVSIVDSIVSELYGI